MPPAGPSHDPYLPWHSEYEISDESVRGYYVLSCEVTRRPTSSLETMNSHLKVIFVSVLILSARNVRAGDLSANASRDAMRLVACMKSFDSACANSLTYTKVFEDHGISRGQLEQRVADQYQKLKSMHATYSRFDLDAPWPPFVASGRNYVFVPYNMTLETGEQRAASKSFLIGVSEDSGASWKFVDGQRVTQDNIGMFVPGYAGDKLPPTSFSPSASR
jgi:hypothetical protein